MRDKLGIGYNWGLTEVDGRYYSDGGDGQDSKDGCSLWILIPAHAIFCQGLPEPWAFFPAVLLFLSTRGRGGPGAGREQTQLMTIFIRPQLLFHSVWLSAFNVEYHVSPEEISVWTSRQRTCLFRALLRRILFWTIYFSSSFVVFHPSKGCFQLVAAVVIAFGLHTSTRTITSLFWNTKMMIFFKWTRGCSRNGNLIAWRNWNDCYHHDTQRR